MGGNVAQAFAAEYPQRTTALGLIDTTAWYGADAPARFKERADTAQGEGDARDDRLPADALVLGRVLRAAILTC